jgi:hypothetical protein
MPSRVGVLLREAQRADDRPLDRVGDLEEPVDRVRLEPHVGVDPEQPLGVLLLEELATALLRAPGIPSAP